MGPDEPAEEASEGQVTPDRIIGLMRTTRKTDQLFKPLKKLKAALQSIGYNNVSNQPSPTIVLFHFGLGNSQDLQLIRRTQLPEQIAQKSPILPGKAYCYLNFGHEGEASAYLENKYRAILEGTQVWYNEVQQDKTARILIGLFSTRAQAVSGESLWANLPDTASHYQPGTIPSIALREDFITKQEQTQLLHSIDSQKWSRLNNRRVQHYGYEFQYGSNNIDKGQQYENPMPQFIQPILARLAALDLPHSFDQMTINDYYPGDGIPAHFDTHSPFQEHFVAVSMLSGIVMDWRRYDNTEKQLYLPQRSLVMFSGEGRYAWTHGIACRKVDRVGGELRHRHRRISITLRKIRHRPCQCPFYFYCDSQGYDQLTMKKSNPLLLKYMAEVVNRHKLADMAPEQVYSKYVVQAYNGFGFDFHNRAIPLVQQSLHDVLKSMSNEQSQLPIFINVLDIGCGNGEYMGLFAGEGALAVNSNEQGVYFHYTGIEPCLSMLPHDGKLNMDGLALAFRPCSFDLLLCIAVLHHMPSAQMRSVMLRQAARVLAKGGFGVVSVLGYEQKQHIYGQQDVIMDYCLQAHKVQGQEEQEKRQEGGKGGSKGRVFERYYHLFTRGEFLSALEDSGLRVVSINEDKQNFVAVIRHKQ